MNPRMSAAVQVIGGFGQGLINGQLVLGQGGHPLGRAGRFLGLIISDELGKTQEHCDLQVFGRHGGQHN